jgi:hypothetical protein
MSFETRGKTKPPSDMAYPVSRSVLQERLAAIPQKDLVSVFYHHHNRMTDQRWKKTKMGRAGQVRRDSSGDFLEATRERSAVGIGTPNAFKNEESQMNKYSQDRWEMSVRAIPAGDLPAVRKWLDQEGFARISDWFIETGKHGGTIGTERLIVKFDGEKLNYLRSSHK